MQNLVTNPNSVKPKTWNPRDVYLQYVATLLKDNPSYWGKYSKPRKMRNFWVYTLINDKVTEVINFDRWRAVVSSYFMSARTHIINGEVLNMHNYLGKIEPRRVERNHDNKKINFFATNQRPKVKCEETGKLRPDVIVYYVDDDWCRIAWIKTGHIPNETAYKFTPCSGDVDKDGFKEQFSNEHIANPALKFNYKFFPFIRQRKLKTGVNT